MYYYFNRINDLYVGTPHVNDNTMNIKEKTLHVIN